MPRPRFHRADPSVQRALLDAALVELGEHGYEGASLNRILAAAGLSKGAFYYYFDDKADLAATVLERELATWDLGSIDLGTTAAEFWARLERYSADSLERLRETPAARDLLTRVGAAIPHTPELLERLGPLMKDAQQRLTSVWEKGQAVGAVRTDLPAATLIALAQSLKMTLGSAMLPVDGRIGDADLARFTRVYIDMLRRMTEATEQRP
jgi:AcrR family transcriptional regulator